MNEWSFQRWLFTDQMNVSNHFYVEIDYRYYTNSPIVHYYLVEWTKHRTVESHQEAFHVRYHYVLTYENPIELFFVSSNHLHTQIEIRHDRLHPVDNQHNWKKKKLPCEKKIWLKMFLLFLAPRFLDNIGESSNEYFTSKIDLNSFGFNSFSTDEINRILCSTCIFEID